MGLLLTFLLGLFIISGAIIVFVTNNNDRFVDFSISLAFGVILMLIFVDLLPEAYELLKQEKILYTIGYLLLGIIVGFILLSTLDHFIPDHDEDIHTKEDDDKNLKHIGLVSSIALVIHNLVEGMAIYLLVNSDLKTGLLACCGVGLHNIPFGMVIASTFYKENQNQKKTMLIILGISFSTFVGGLFVFFFPVTSVMKIIESISFTLTIGMLIYILLMELLPKILHSREKKITMIGILLGILLLWITVFL